MGQVSKELNSILNENKDPVSLEGKSPALFILLIIVTVTAVYFAALYFNSQKNNPKDNKKKYERIIKENVLLKQKKDEIEQRLIKLQKEKKKVQVIKEKVVTVQKIDKENFYKIYNSDNTKSVNCYDYNNGNDIPTKKCIESIKNFLEDNNNAFRYQIITVISQEEINKYSKYNKKAQDFLLTGLSTKRVSEITWQMKKILGDSIIVTSNNYYVKSKKKNNGIIIKAYF